MIKKIAAFALMVVACFSLMACGAKLEPYKDGKITVGAMNGPTMMGLGELNNKLDANSKYKLEKVGTADAIVAGLANGTFDAACLPANNAAIIFNSGNIDIQVAAINTLNVLYLMQKAGTPNISSLSDLSGKTVYMPGQGTTPEYSFRHLLAKNKIENVNIEFETEGGVIAAGLKQQDSKYDYAVLPQPVATAATMGAGAAVQALDLSQEWQKHHPSFDVVTGVLVVRTAYLEKNKATFDKFLEDYEASVQFMSNANNAEAAASFVVDMGIVPNINLAKAALPKCGLTYIEKNEMKEMLVDFYSILHAENSQAIGGKLPKDNFYYI